MAISFMAIFLIDNYMYILYCSFLGSSCQTMLNFDVSDQSKILGDSDQIKIAKYCNVFQRKVFIPQVPTALQRSFGSSWPTCTVSLGGRTCDKPIGMSTAGDVSDACFWEA